MVFLLTTEAMEAATSTPSYPLVVEALYGSLRDRRPLDGECTSLPSLALEHASCAPCSVLQECSLPGCLPSSTQTFRFQGELQAEPLLEFWWVVRGGRHRCPQQPFFWGLPATPTQPQPPTYVPASSQLGCSSSPRHPTGHTCRTHLEKSSVQTVILHRS